MYKHVLITELRNGDVFCFSDEEKQSRYQFCEYLPQYDAIVVKHNGVITMLNVDDHYRHVSVEYKPRMSSYRKFEINGLFEREKSIILSITKNLKLIEENEKVTFPAFTTLKSYSAARFAHAETVTLHNEKDFVIISIESKDYKKPYSLILHKNSQETYHDKLVSIAKSKL